MFSIKTRAIENINISIALAYFGVNSFLVQCKLNDIGLRPRLFILQTRIYFNTKGRKGGSEAIRNMLEYMQNSRKTAAVDSATTEVDKYVSNVRLDPEIRGKYMTFGEKLDRTYIEAQDRLLIKQVCHNLSQGMSASDMANIFCVEEGKISNICEAAEKYAPDYDQDAIFDELQKEKV